MCKYSLHEKKCLILDIKGIVSQQTLLRLKHSLTTPKYSFHFIIYSLNLNNYSRYRGISQIQAIYYK